MCSMLHKEKAVQFRQFHHETPMLVLPNIWEAASARIIEQTGFRPIATTSSGVTAALGYRDGQHISRDMLIKTVKEVITTGVVGINIEDSLKLQEKALVDISYQVELIKALRELATSMDVPFVIKARVDVFLLAIGEPESRLEHTIQRANAYQKAGVDCIYPIGRLDSSMIAMLVKAINGPINILGGPPMPTLKELEQFGVARVSLAGGLMRSMLGHVRAIAHELLESGSYTRMSAEALSSSEFSSLFNK